MTGLHPLTCLTTLTKKQKQLLFDRGTVLCGDIKQNPALLRKVGIPDSKQSQVIEEAQRLCVPRIHTESAE